MVIASHAEQRLMQPDTPSSTADHCDEGAAARHAERRQPCLVGRLAGCAAARHADRHRSLPAKRAADAEQAMATAMPIRMPQTKTSIKHASRDADAADADRQPDHAADAAQQQTQTRFAVAGHADDAGRLLKGKAAALRAADPGSILGRAARPPRGCCPRRQCS